MFSRLALWATSAFFAMAISIPMALATDVPEIDPITSPIDATKVIISGHTEPDYKIVVTGGSYQIPPIYADETGYFEIQVALVQEATNTYTVKAVDPDNLASDQVDVVIVEGEEAAAEAEASGGGDRTAPSAPEVHDVPEMIDAGTYLFSGTAEAGATILISGTKSGSTLVRSDESFQIFMNLEQNAVNNFTFTAKDTAGNVSAGVKVTIEEISEEPDAEITETEEGIEIEIMGDDDDDDGEADVMVIAISDINDHWAKDYIVDLLVTGAVSGYDDGTFRPDAAVTRAEFVKMIIGAFGYEVQESVSESNFTDVDADAWFAPYTEAARDAQIAEGYDDGTFRPGNTVNRAEAMKMFMSAAGVDVSDAPSSTFPDVLDTDWFALYVMKASEMGVVGGYSNGDFGPGDLITRGQVAKVIVELMDQL
jgi:hypothetical protein